LDRSPELLARSRELRKAQTSAEEVLWERLRNRKLGGFKFRRQHSIGEVVLDFYCAEADLAIEVDGGIHERPATSERDGLRTRWLEQVGVRVIRVTNQDVREDTEGVLCRIAALLPSPASGRGVEERGGETLTPGGETLTPGPSPACGRGVEERGGNREG
jgi:very-short-patch-repair endonuclease